MKRKRNSKTRFTDKAHVQSVCNMQCMMRTFKVAEYCKGPTQAHHLLKPYDGARGMGMRSNDKNVIPLCQHHHHLLHTKFGSEKAFFTAYGMPEDIGKKIAESLYTTTSTKEIDDNTPF